MHSLNFKASLRSVRRVGYYPLSTRRLLATRQSLDWTTLRRIRRYGRLSRSWRSIRLDSRTPPVASLSVDQPLSTESFTQSELSNGPLPITLEFGELLGRGTFGEVYRGIDVSTGQDFAVKIISKKRAGNDPAAIRSVMEKIEHEVSMWCELQNFPSAVHLEKFYEDAENVYLVQELCTGGSLQDFMAIRGFLSEVETAHIMTTVLSLLVFCHSRNICFLDIKPANFILPGSTQIPNLSPTVENDFLKVVDFGTCEHVPKRGLRGVKGTPLYTAPEVQTTRYGNPASGMSQSSLDFYIAHAELKFEGEKWSGISEEAKNLISAMLDRSVKDRITAEEALQHPWIKQRSAIPVFSNSFSGICPMEAPIKAFKEI